MTLYLSTFNAFSILMWSHFKPRIFAMTPKLELRSLTCIPETHKLVVSIGIYIR